MAGAKWEQVIDRLLPIIFLPLAMVSFVIFVVVGQVIGAVIGWILIRLSVVLRFVVSPAEYSRRLLITFSTSG